MDGKLLRIVRSIKMNFAKYIAEQFAKPTGNGGVLSTFFMNRLNQKQYKCVMNNICCPQNGKVLDIGFGNGYLIGRFARQNIGDFYGIEISGDMLKAGVKRNNKFVNQGKLHLSKGTALDIPFENSFFDSVYTVNTVYFWSDLDKGLSEVSRVLKRNGIFINAFYSKQWLDKIKYTQYGFNKYIKEELENALIHNGFKIYKTVEIKENMSYCIISQKA
jgi:ubiquinone/menaquinone biosynthesis C-methylase UbiE